ncbi:hypothetical protein LIA77_02628 [Sarocladium implicatum]|nr:hypothetical protein LIA77_02628 [Sarocladium implicatum]
MRAGLGALGETERAVLRIGTSYGVAGLVWVVPWLASSSIRDSTTLRGVRSYVRCYSIPSRNEHQLNMTS